MKLKRIFILMSIIFILLGITYFIIKIMDWKQQKEIVRRFEKVVVEDKNCTTLQQQVDTFFEEINYCQKDSDCRSDKSLGKLTGCAEYLVNKSLYQKGTLQSLLGRAYRSAEKICPHIEFVCGNIPNAEIHCINKKCRVEF